MKTLLNILTFCLVLGLYLGVGLGIVLALPWLGTLVMAVLTLYGRYLNRVLA